MTNIAEATARPGSTPEESSRVSLSQQIYDALREGIIRGQYPQGSRLAEQRLAMELGVSRVPLREAVPLLEIDGFIATLPRRGAVVTTWSIESANELFDLRLCLEVGAARYAARMAGQGATCEPLRKSLQLSSAGIASGDAYRIAQDSADFHKLVVDLTGNTLMRALMRSVSGRMMWLFFLTSELDENDAYHGHQELAAAIESGNERVAEAVAYAHIERDRADSLRTMAAHGTR